MVINLRHSLQQIFCRCCKRLHNVFTVERQKISQSPVIHRKRKFLPRNSGLRRRKQPHIQTFIARVESASDQIGKIQQMHLSDPRYSVNTQQ